MRDIYNSTYPIRLHMNFRMGTFLVVFFGATILMGAFNSSVFGKLGPIGSISIALVLLLGICSLLFHIVNTGAVPRIFTSFIITGCMLTVFYIAAAFVGDLVPRGIIVTGQWASVFLFSVGMSLLRWDDRNIKVLSFIASVFVVGNLSLWVACGLSVPFSGYFQNPNCFGAFVVFLLCFPMLCYGLSKGAIHKGFSGAVILCGLVLCVASLSRSVWLVMVVALCTYYVWGVLLRRRWCFHLYFIGLLCGIVVFSYLYPHLALLSEADCLNRVVHHYTGGNLFSGRQVLWLSAINASLQQPWLGFGTGISMEEIAGTTLSAHNLYLQMALQIGLIGLTMFGFLMWSIWRLFWMGRYDPVVRITASAFMGMLVHQVFEVSLTTNNLAIGILQWLVIAVGLSKSRDAYRSNRRAID